MLRKADAPYWNHSAFKNALNSTPDLVVIMLGTNDAKFRNWNAANGTGRNLGAGSEYADDYKTMYVSVLPVFGTHRCLRVAFRVCLLGCLASAAMPPNGGRAANV